MELLWVSDGTGEENESFKHFISDEPRPISASSRNGPRWTRMAEEMLSASAEDGVLVTCVVIVKLFPRLF